MLCGSHSDLELLGDIHFESENFEEYARKFTGYSN